MRDSPGRGDPRGPKDLSKSSRWERQHGRLRKGFVVRRVGLLGEARAADLPRGRAGLGFPNADEAEEGTAHGLTHSGFSSSEEVQCWMALALDLWFLVASALACGMQPLWHGAPGMR